MTIRPELPLTDFFLSNSGTYCPQLMNNIANVAIGAIFAGLVVIAVFVLVREWLFKQKMDSRTYDDEAEIRRKNSRSEEMTPEEIAECERRLDLAIDNICSYTFEDRPEVWMYDDYCDVSFARSQIEYCNKIGLTDQQLFEKRNRVYRAWEASMERHYLLWESGSFGKAVLGGGAVVAVLLFIWVPTLGIAIGASLLVYLLAGRTPMCVAVNPHWLDSLLNRLTAGVAVATCAILPFSLEYREVRYYDAHTGVFHHSETESAGMGAIIVIAIFAALSVVLAVFRVALLFIRNYLLYRSNTRTHKALSWLMLIVAGGSLIWIYQNRGCGYCSAAVLLAMLMAIISVVTNSLFVWVEEHKRLESPKLGLVKKIAWIVSIVVSAVLLGTLDRMVVESCLAEEYNAERVKEINGKHRIGETYHREYNMERVRQTERVRRTERDRQEAQERRAVYERERQARDEKERQAMHERVRQAILEREKEKRRQQVNDQSTQKDASKAESKSVSSINTSEIKATPIVSVDTRDAEKPIAVVQEESRSCHECSGKGVVETMFPCSMCNGKGTILKRQDCGAPGAFITVKSRCPQCAGNRRVKKSSPCQHCNGKGILE